MCYLYYAERKMCETERPSDKPPLLHADSYRMHLPLHLDSGNRGCEAIALGTAKVLDVDKKRFVLLTRNLNLDSSLALHDVATLVPSNSLDSLNPFRRFVLKARGKMFISDSKRKSYFYGLIYDSFLNAISRNDIVLITGGDMLCYDNNEIIYISDALAKREIKSVLWGCSIGKENLTEEKIAALSKFSLITARESLTFRLLDESLSLNNVHLVPDSAFILEPSERELPSFFAQDNLIGINLSNYVTNGFGPESLFSQNMDALIDYILSNTDYEIVFIPHVFWKGQDDRIVCKTVLDKYNNHDRLHYLDTSDMSYKEIRYAISKCRFFIGARTHAMISAYSTMVPALALGYSIKSRGIALDLGLEDNLVIDCRCLSSNSVFLDRFKLLEDEEDAIRKKLASSLADYRSKCYLGKKLVSDLQARSA